MGVLQAVLDVFSGVATWFAGAFEVIIPMFWAEGAAGEPGTLTFLGVLSLAGLSLSVCFLLIRVISNFLSFRG